jgi:two-component system sensor histidine kinase/response regulator
MLNLPANTSYVLAGSNCADFLLLLSPNFLAGLGIQSVANSEHYHLNLIFAIDEIENFLLAIHQTLPTKHQWRPLLKKWSSQLQPNDSNWQSQFTLRLIAALAVPPAALASTGKSPLSIVLVQQANQEKLLAEVVTNIRQLLDLPVILQTTVERVQNYLQVDRLIIYQFHKDTLKKKKFCSGGVGLFMKNGVMTLYRRR